MTSSLAIGCAFEQQAQVAGPGPIGGSRVTLSGRTHRNGTASATLANGDHCTGAFNTVASHVTFDDERPTWIDSEDSQVGMLLLSCASGASLRCDFWRRTEGAGNGECRDGRGVHYTLVL